MTEPDHPFDAPWQAQLFAMTVAASEAGAFAWSDWAEVFGAELAARGPAAEGNAGYYEAWLAACATLMGRLGHAEVTEIEDVTRAWQEAALATPHGTAIALKR